ncbi:MAG: hypothetical protein SGJ05_04205 [bacterium]|nr:hypothetical protein [bacterium]
MKTLLVLLMCCLTMQAQNEVEFLTTRLPFYTNTPCEMMLAPWGATTQEVMKRAKKARLTFVSKEHHDSTTSLTYRKGRLVVGFEIDDKKGYWIVGASLKALDAEDAQILVDLASQYLQVAYAGPEHQGEWTQECKDGTVYATCTLGESWPEVYAIYTAKWSKRRS